MRKLITITTMIFGVLFFIVAPASIVNASGGCENPGPYGSTPYGTRICNTGIVFSDLDTSISSEIALALGGVFTLGSILTMNGKLIKSRIN